MKKQTPKKKNLKANRDEEMTTSTIEIDTVEFDTVQDAPSVTPKTGRSNFLLYIVLAVALLIAGNLYSQVKVLQKDTAKPAAPAAAGQQGAAPAKTPEIASDDPILGDKNAKVTMIIYEDFQCPFCGAFTGHNPDMVTSMKGRDPSWEPTITNVTKDYVQTNKVKLVWKDYPFLGQESYKAAEAARCAQDQGKFWEFHDYLFSHQNGENQGNFSNDNLKKFAQTLGLNMDDFNKCFDGGKYTKKMQEAQAAGQAVGVSGTPGVFVNGEFTSGAASYSQFKAQIDKALQS